MSETKFDLWLEFEHWEWKEGDDPEDDFFNMHIQLANGETYALNVWTFKFFSRLRQGYQESGENLSGKYLVAPDLFVERLDRNLVTEVVRDLVSNHGLKIEWLVPESEEEL
jgi:hypothetical protein